MPIYAYKCDSCGFSKDVLQKITDAPLSDCPSCGAPSFNKQLTAPGFQLKGSGWYATDFKGTKPGAAAPTEPVAASKDSPNPSPSPATPETGGGAKAEAATASAGAPS